MIGDYVRIIASCAMVTLLFNNCSHKHIPPGTNKTCVKEIYQEATSPGPSLQESFNGSLNSGWDSTPGITWKTGKTMRASADGIVSNIITLHTGRHGGEMVTIKHGDSIFTYYAHLDDVFVKTGQRVNRVDTIGNPDNARIPKLMIKVHGNWESPDNWGPNNDLMVKRNVLPERETYNSDLMRQMRTIRFSIIKTLYYSTDVQTLDWYQRIHNPNRRWDAVAEWSLVEHMRYLECLYDVEPERFKGMTPEKFNEKRDEFYKNQPLVLTIPF